MLLVDLILFLDGEAIIVDKPSGLPVDPPRDGGLSVESHLSTLTFGFKRWPLAGHRRDRDTSGCLLLARNPKAHARFQRVFEAGLVEKTYIAVVEGVPEGGGGTIDMPLAKISSAEAGWRMIVDPKGKRAVTHWRQLAVVGDRTLIEFKPETGRTHQLRVHAATGLGTPIAGDPMYGRGVGNMLLHASRLSLPRDGKPPVEAFAKLPDRFAMAGFGDV